MDQFEAFYCNKAGQAGVTRRNKLTAARTEDGFIKGAMTEADELRLEFVAEPRIATSFSPENRDGAHAVIRKKA